MRKFTNPLDNIHVASPCSANWNEMYGSDRKRFCGDCKLNVYNLSDMSRQEAENLLLTSEGRLCFRFFRRADGTVLTKNCPVGWRAVERRVSRVATAAFSMVAGLFGGIFAIRATESVISLLPSGDVPEPISDIETFPVVGEIDSLEIRGQVDLRDVRRTKLRTKRVEYYDVLGRVEKFEPIDKKPVVAWIK